MAAVEATPSHMRVAPGGVNITAATLPNSPDVNPDERNEVVQNFVNAFNAALESSDVSAISQLFADIGYLRDHLALSWSFRTLLGPQKVKTFLEDCKKPTGSLPLRKIQIDDGSPFRAPNVIPLDVEGTAKCVLAFFTFESTLGTGRGAVRLIPENGNWKIYTFYTLLESLKDYPESIGGRRPLGAEHGINKDRKNWAARRKDEVECRGDYEPKVIVLGAGQAGLTIAVRLKALGVQSLVIDQNERIGDNWRKRYAQLVLHDPVWYDHFPYIQFPASWPVFTPKDKLADFFESYAKLMELNVWMSSTLKDAQYDDDKKIWTVTVERKLEDGSMDKRVFHPTHVIQATGHSGKKNMPSIPGIQSFQGDTLCHSSEFKGAKEGASGKKAVVVGSCNSAHDIAQDYFEKGYDVTMVQRSSTCVVTSDSILNIYLKNVYEEGGPPVEDADLFGESVPTPLLKAIHTSVVPVQNLLEAEMRAGLEKAGFKLDSGADDSGHHIKYYQRGGGYYIDVGASKLIANGDIKIKQGQEVTGLLPRGVKFADGSELEADEVVFATGYQSMKTMTRSIFGDKVADRIGEVWGLNEEGEFNTIWQKSGHPGFWFHGGNLALCRHYSRLLALQIKAIEEGLLQW
ncbi:hypothetical protein B0I35DRAFT_475715 [Stachybotrys elegans]|uniref:FAD/NAD(P)-binding domain-containing protein n=1 Tax=Stachybotrys elegans TaxID=80388 RepID=A0A8K0T0P9_9HYPO|nr:hypothetical protein B0I35DRAFT_475715 [Stachybotrys elegans]